MTSLFQSQRAKIPSVQAQRADRLYQIIIREREGYRNPGIAISGPLEKRKEKYTLSSGRPCAAVALVGLEPLADPAAVPPTWYRLGKGLTAVEDLPEGQDNEMSIRLWAMISRHSTNANSSAK